VLDPQQNDTFKDHYLEVPLDLSKVMFITTANVLDTIPPPLRDRMEIIRIPGYTEEEKVAIARRHLLPRQMDENGLRNEDLFVTQGALRQIARGYTREAGVRNLEREVGRVCRKAARRIAENIGVINREDQGTPTQARPHLCVTAFNLEEYLDQPKVESEMGGREPQIGVTTGMAWTPLGGEILFIETAKVSNGGGLVLTGQLGDVMKESAQIAYDFLRSDAGKKIGGKNANGGVHIHVPAGAIPKDGPSAGVAITAALASLLSGRPARHDIAMTGEVTLTGRVLPVGGIKEKVLAARQAGINTIILPERNRADVKDIPEATRSELKFEFISDVRDAVEHVLLPAGKATTARRRKAVTTPMEQDTSRTDPPMGES
jgi:ATP-dependent Lon protease